MNGQSRSDFTFTYYIHLPVRVPNLNLPLDNVCGQGGKSRFIPFQLQDSYTGAKWPPNGCAVRVCYLLFILSYCSQKCVTRSKYYNKIVMNDKACQITSFKNKQKYNPSNTLITILPNNQKLIAYKCQNRHCTRTLSGHMT